MAVEIEHRTLYGTLFRKYGELGWWPAESADEVIIGAVLTQNTSWGNVESSLKKLREKGLLSLRALAEASLETVKQCIRSSGFFNQKSLYLMSLAEAITGNFGTVENMAKYGMQACMEFLISRKGVGFETMESIMLYALDFPVSVVDAYTERILGRLYRLDGFTRGCLRQEMEEQLDRQVGMLKNYHAMLVQHAKDSCRKKPDCESCPLKAGCSYFMDLSSP